MASLPDRADVVVGGGITGVSLAYHLAARGLATVLLERSRLASGPTGRSTAIVRAHYSQPLLVQMALVGLATYSSFDATVGGSCGFTRTGVLWLVSPEDRPALEANVVLAREVGAEIELVEPAGLASVDSRIAGEGVGAACYEPGSGHFDPYLATTGFARAAEKKGAQVVEGVGVLAVCAGGAET